MKNLGITLTAGLLCLGTTGKTSETPAEANPMENLSKNLSQHVHKLAGEIGERNLVAYDGLNRAADYIAGELTSYGLTISRQSYQARPALLRRKWRGAGDRAQLYCNVIGEIRGTTKPEEIVVIGAHYDSVAIKGCRGANDNASGVAATLELARFFAAAPQHRTIRFVAFANEEPPFFWSAGMGSYVYAKACRTKNEKIVGMLTPETIGCYSDEPGSQRYPLPLFSWFYPTRGNFIAWVANSGSGSFQRRCLRVFRANSSFPASGAVLPKWIPHTASSDHWAFARMGYPALMVTDTAMYRYRYYHTAKDDPERLDYGKMAQVVAGMKAVVTDLAN